MHTAMAEQSGMLARFLPMGHQDRIPFLVKAEETPVAASYRVLIVESSASLARLLATGLASDSLSVEVTHDLSEGLCRLDGQAYDLLILDMDLADLDGATILSSLHARWPEMRVLSLSGRSGVEDRVLALDNGADDYLLKPFSLLELMARVRVMRRRATPAAPVAATRASKVTLCADQCRVDRDGRSIDLTPREFALLEYMMQNPGKTLTRSTLSQEVWNMPAEANTNIVDVYIKYLRDKLDEGHDEKLIRTVRGMGYLFQMSA